MCTIKDLKDFYLNQVLFNHHVAYAKVSKMYDQYKKRKLCTRDKTETDAKNKNVNSIEHFMMENDM
jgi:hypothetical protein